ncbi:hypothetical protein MMH89_02360 [Candidatus Comchoanobacter bicostacola]|uniref:Uncharacterized protein n=1 Tax=Candidatus Comchoanobacter bicostacola TaxID=2919598 RepID=A0ABY5DN27_9GAMM|nr:hypothetical protein [Candidatus Comchoanobacter bicostacola]UTC24987.1 hypothetical protein MMH89_02360 [Candidatus Comchoanobacter bicostacola]
MKTKNKQANHKKVSRLKYIFIYCVSYLYLRFVRKIPLAVQIILFPLILVGFILDTIFHAILYGIFILSDKKDYTKLKKSILKFYQKYYNRLEVRKKHEKNIMIHIHEDDHNGYIVSSLGVAGIYALTRKLSKKYNIYIRHFNDEKGINQIMRDEAHKKTPNNHCVHVIYAHGGSVNPDPLYKELSKEMTKEAKTAASMINDDINLERPEYIKRINDGMTSSQRFKKSLIGAFSKISKHWDGGKTEEHLKDCFDGWHSEKEDDKQVFDEYKHASKLIYWGCHTQGSHEAPNYIGSNDTVYPGGELLINEENGKTTPQVTFMCIK